MDGEDRVEEWWWYEDGLWRWDVLSVRSRYPPSDQMSSPFLPNCPQFFLSSALEDLRTPLPPHHSTKPSISHLNQSLWYNITRHVPLHLSAAQMDIFHSLSWFFSASESNINMIIPESYTTSTNQIKRVSIYKKDDVFIHFCPGYFEIQCSRPADRLIHHQLSVNIAPCWPKRNSTGQRNGGH